MIAGGLLAIAAAVKLLLGRLGGEAWDGLASVVSYSSKLIAGGWPGLPTRSRNRPAPRNGAPGVPRPPLSPPAPSSRPAEVNPDSRPCSRPTFLLLRE